MGNEKNILSIIIPVRDGGHYIRECISSILSQSSGEFNVIVLDSGSTDGTVEYIRSLENDKISLHTSDRPLSIEENWGRILQVPKAEWMTIIGHDDLISPDYVAEIRNSIRSNPSASCHTTLVNFIDEAGNLLRQGRKMPETQTSHDLLKKILCNEIDAVGFVVRSADYERKKGIPLFPGLLFADYPLWIEMADISGLQTVQKYLLRYRIHKKSTTASSDQSKYYTAYEMFINYLNGRKSGNEQDQRIIEQYAGQMMKQRCIEFSKKLLFTPACNRAVYFRVKDLVAAHYELGKKTVGNNKFNPFGFIKIKLAIFADSTIAGQALLNLLIWFRRRIVFKK